MVRRGFVNTGGTRRNCWKLQSCLICPTTGSSVSIRSAQRSRPRFVRSLRHIRYLAGSLVMVRPRRTGSASCRGGSFPTRRTDPLPIRTVPPHQPDFPAPLTQTTDHTLQHGEVRAAVGIPNHFPFTSNSAALAPPLTGGLSGRTTTSPGTQFRHPNYNETTVPFPTWEYRSGVQVSTITWHCLPAAAMAAPIP